MKTHARLCVTTLAALLLVVSVGCDSNPAPSPSPTPDPTPTRIIGLGGNLAFGSVEIGSERELTLTISNMGTDTLNVRGITSPDGYSVSWASGAILSHGQQVVTMRFSPTEEGPYDGTMTVSGNQTSGTNTMAISGTGVRPPALRTQSGGRH
jgi:hypothetical protein